MRVARTRFYCAIAAIRALVVSVEWTPYWFDADALSTASPTGSSMARRSLALEFVARNPPRCCVRAGGARPHRSRRPPHSRPGRAATSASCHPLKFHCPIARLRHVRRQARSYSLGRERFSASGRGRNNRSGERGPAGAAGGTGSTRRQVRVRRRTIGRWDRPRLPVGSLGRCPRQFQA